MNPLQRSIHVAITQMDVCPASTGERLYRADLLVQDAVQMGAELVVLPELFNTGYCYSEDNFQRAESMDGSTVTWMKRTARRMGAHLAGSLLLLDQGDIYNAMLIAAPDGRTWRYDKSYPWAWERGYFVENRGKGAQRAVVAQTALGNLGMLICWDTAHTELWQAYAGQVDLMVICSSPPQIGHPTFHLPPDVELTGQHLGPVWAALEGESGKIFDSMVKEQAAWLGVPVAHSTACGPFESPVPNGRGTLLGLVPNAPGLALYLPRADQLHLTTTMVDACQVVSAQGQTLARLPQSRGEGLALAEITLPERAAHPASPQPTSQASRMTYFFSDTILPRLMKTTYEQGIQRVRANGKT